MKDQNIIDPDTQESGLVRKNLHYKVIAILGAVVLVAVWIKFDGKRAHSKTFKPEAPQASQLGNAPDPGAVERARADAERRTEEKKKLDAQAEKKAAAIAAQQARDAAARGATPGTVVASVVPSAVPGSVSGTASASTIPSSVSNSVLPPLPTAYAPLPSRGDTHDVEREAMARNAKILVSDNAGGAGTGGAPAAPGGFVPPQMTDAQREMLAHAADPSAILRSIPGMQGGGQAPSAASANQQWLNDYGGKGSAHAVQTGYAPPASYYVRGNTPVQAITTRAINSDLSGPIELRVTSDVYDSITGTQIMIPKGSTISGANNGDIRLGQERIEVGLDRICRPDGICVDTPGSQGADGSGATGFEGDVNNHILKIMLTSLIPAGIAYATTPKNSGSGVSVYGAGSSPMTAAGQIMVQTSQTVLNRTGSAPPTITVTPGTPVSVIVAKDIVLPPYQR